MNQCPPGIEQILDTAVEIILREPTNIDEVLSFLSPVLQSVLRPPLEAAFWLKSWQALSSPDLAFVIDSKRWIITRIKLGHGVNSYYLMSVRGLFLS